MMCEFLPANKMNRPYCSLGTRHWLELHADRSSITAQLEFIYICYDDGQSYIILERYNMFGRKENSFHRIEVKTKQNKTKKQPNKITAMAKK